MEDIKIENNNEYIRIPYEIISKGVFNNECLMTYIYLQYRKNIIDEIEFTKKSFYTFMGVKKPEVRMRLDLILDEILNNLTSNPINISDLRLNDIVICKLTNIATDNDNYEESKEFAKIYFDEIDSIIEHEKKSELSVSAKKIFLFLSYHRLKMIKRNGALIETAPEISYFRINDLSEQLNISTRTISRILKILTEIKIIKTAQTKTFKIPDTTYFIKGYIVVADFYSRDIKYTTEDNLKYGIKYVENKQKERKRL